MLYLNIFQAHHVILEKNVDRTQPVLHKTHYKIQEYANKRMEAMDYAAEPSQKISKVRIRIQNKTIKLEQYKF